MGYGDFSIREIKNPKTGKSYTPKRWDCVISFGSDPITGRKARVHRRLRGTKSEVRRTLHRIKAERLNGITADAENLTVSAFMDTYLSNREALGELETNTARGYRGYVRRWVEPFIGACTVKDLKPLAIESWYREAAKAGASGTTINHAHKLMKMAYRKAVRDGLALSNPFELVSAPKKDTRKRGYLEPDEAGRLLRILDSEIGFTGFAAAVRAGLATGARRGEVLALQWADVDFKSGTVRIWKSLVQVDGAKRQGRQAKAVKTPKTESGNRTVTLDAGSLQWLSRWKREQKSELAALGVVQVPRTPVCCSTYGHKFGGVAVFAGGTLDPSAFSSQFGRFCDRYGFKDSNGKRLVFHELRHTQATYLLSSGEDVVNVSARMGHASPSITEDMYAHAMPQRDRECAGTIGAILREAERKAV